MKSITPFLWFDGQAEEAAERYTSIFPDGKVHRVDRLPDGTVLTVEFEVAGQHVRALDGGPHFTLDEAFSFFVECDDQDEVDRYWDALLADGGEESRCGWLKDRFGVSWQVVPTRFLEMVATGTPEQVGRVMEVLQTMQKLDVARFEEAYAG